MLGEAGSRLDRLVRVRYYITDRAHADALFAVTGEVLGTIRPAATLVICDLLEPQMLVEIEATATLNER